MVVNDWNNTMMGHVAATNTMARMFFMLFYVFCVLVVLNVVLAFILETFQVVVVGRLLAMDYPRDPIEGSEPAELEGGIFHRLFLVRHVDFDKEQAYEFFPAHHEALQRLNTRGSAEMASGRLRFKGTRGLTHLALFRLLYQDDVPRWIAEEENNLSVDPVEHALLGTDLLRGAVSFNRHEPTESVEMKLVPADMMAQDTEASTASKDQHSAAAGSYVPPTLHPAPAAGHTGSQE